MVSCEGMLPERCPLSAIASAFIRCKEQNCTHPGGVSTINARQNRGEGLYVRWIAQGPSPEISFNRVMGVLRRTLLRAGQPDPGHLCQIFHSEKSQSCVHIVFLIPSTVGSADTAGFPIGVLLVSECAVEPAVTLTGIPIEVTSVFRRWVPGSCGAGSRSGKGG